jgi:hypothetical protein
LTSLSGVICRGVVARLPTLEIVKPRFLILIRLHPEAVTPEPLILRRGHDLSAFHTIAGG